MKLLELTGVKSHYDKDVFQIQDLLQSGGKFIKAGDGYFAIVFKHDSNVAYKFWGYDPAYEKFVNFCNKHKDNPFFPKFKSPVKKMTAFFKRPETFPDKLSYVKVELLTEFNENASRIGNMPTLSFIEFFTDYVQDLKNDDSLEQQVEWTMARPRFKSLEKTDAVKKQITELYEALGLILKELGTINDLHIGNLMMRGTQVVITDPIADSDAIQYMHELHGLMKSKDNFTLSGPSRTKK